MKIRSTIKAGSLTMNHTETLVKPSLKLSTKSVRRTKGGVAVQTGIVAGKTAKIGLGSPSP